MKTSNKSEESKVLAVPEAGNAMIYVLIAIVLFAALSFIVSRQNDNSETSTLDQHRVEIIATQIIETSMQLKQGVDQMLYGGTDPDNLDFVTPDTEPAFSAGTTHINKVFHPSGGGIVLQPLPSGSTNQVSNDPPAQWYIGRFVNIEWTSSAEEEVIMTAHQLTRQVCEAINLRLLGNAAPLVTTANPRDILVDDSLHGGANPVEWTTALCTSCENVIAACVQGPSEVPGANVYSFYSIVLSR